MSSQTHARTDSPSSSSKPRSYRVDLVVLAAYLLLAVVLTYPLVLQFSTHVPGDGRDDPALAWNLWWVPYSILHLGASPIDTNYLFYPVGLNLAYYTLTYLNAFLSIPFQFAFNLVVASNVNLLLSFVLSGYGTYLLVKHLLRIANGEWRNSKQPVIASGSCEAISACPLPWLRGIVSSRTALLAMTGEAHALGVGDSNFEFRILNLCAFIAGVVYAFSSNKMLYASLGQFNIASSQWIPFYILFLLKVTQFGNSKFEIQNSNLPYTESPNHPLTQSPNRPITRSAILLGLFLLFQALSEFIFASFLILFTVVYLVYWLIVNRGKWRALRSVLANLTVAAVVFVVPMAPILSAMLRDLWVEGDYIQQGMGFADVFSNDLLGFIVPSHLNPFFGWLESQFHFVYTNFAYLGLAALALALLALWKEPRAGIWGTLAALLMLVTLGPELRVNGQVLSVPFLPFNLLLEIPFVKGNRYPSRWSVMLTLCLAVLVAYGLSWASRKLKFEFRISNFELALLPLAFLLLTLVEHLSIPLPMSDLRIPGVYQTIAQEPGDFTVLEIPLAWRNGFRQTGTADEAFMFAQWYQTEHRRPILGGNTSRNPELKFQYFSEAPVLSSLIAVENGHALDADRLRRDKEVAPKVLRFFAVRYVVWHSPRRPQNRAALDAARRYVEQTWPVTKVSDVTDELGETVAYRVQDTDAPSAVTIRPGDPLARLYFGEGWGALSGERFVWAQRSQVRLFIPLDTRGRDASLSIGVTLPPGIGEQKALVRVNGQPAGTLTLVGCLDCTVGLTIPARILRAGMNEITLQFDRTVPVAGVQMGNLVSSASGHIPANIVIRSAGEEQGDFGHIYVDGRDLSPNRRGYNLVVLNPETGAVEFRDAFDTFASEAEATRLAESIARVPAGHLALVSVRDEASQHLTREAVDALHSIGAAVDLRGKFRWSHAIIGIKDAAPGSVPEAASEIEPAQLVRGVGITEPNVAAAVEWIKLEAK